MSLQKQVNQVNAGKIYCGQRRKRERRGSNYYEGTKLAEVAVNAIRKDQSGNLPSKMDDL
jgi:hypothetical protein